MSNKDYITILAESLQKKNVVLDEIQKAKEEDIKDDSRYGDDVICSS